MNRIFLGILGGCLLCGTPWANGQEKIRFQKTQLDKEFRSEGVAVGDFNKDGKMDIAAANVWFEAPAWKMHPIVESPETFNPLRYSRSFCNFADDVNGDGWTDLIVVDFPGTQTWWFENPKEAGGYWKKHECISVTNNESPNYLDVDGDKRRELLLGYSPDAKNFDGPDRRLALVRVTDEPTKPWKIQDISAKAAPGTRRFEHGLGVGDMDGDSLNDILTPKGWWKNPGREAPGEWSFYPANLGQNCAQMYVYDFDGDGDQDVLSSSAHNFGIWWHEQTPQGFVEHEIDKSFSQTHALCMADINGDGLPDFITGKRWWAHGPKGDPGSDGPAVVYWFELSRTKDGPKWTPHKVDDNSGIGTQFEVIDINADGLLDIVTSNKQGTFLLQQTRAE